MENHRSLNRLFHTEWCSKRERTPSLNTGSSPTTELLFSRDDIEIAVRSNKIGKIEDTYSALLITRFTRN